MEALTLGSMTELTRKDAINGKNERSRASRPPADLPALSVVWGWGRARLHDWAAFCSDFRGFPVWDRAEEAQPGRDFLRSFHVCSNRDIVKAPAHTAKSLRCSTPITWFQPLFNLTSLQAVCRIPRNCALHGARCQSPASLKPLMHKRCSATRVSQSDSRRAL
jgi:hypothetical protein